MTLRDWLTRSAHYVQSDGLRYGLRESIQELEQGVTYRITSRLDQVVSGDPIFDYEWDVLVIVDACRPDLLATTADNYEFIPTEPDTIRSRGSGSWTWMERNFTSDWDSEMSNTAYITGNPYSDEYVDRGQFAILDEVWRYAWDDDLGTIPARPITDRAVDTARKVNPDRMLVHYMQPHFPSVPDPIGSEINIETFGENWESVWGDLEAGNISSDRVWESYRANLKYVLEDVELLLKNVDGDPVIISADHGNAFGEYGHYGHPPRSPIPTLRQVPWVRTTAQDTGSHVPSTQQEEAVTNATDVSNRLQDLGYL